MSPYQCLIYVHIINIKYQSCLLTLSSWIHTLPRICQSTVLKRKKNQKYQVEIICFSMAVVCSAACYALKWKSPGPREVVPNDIQFCFMSSISSLMWSIWLRISLKSFSSLLTARVFSFGRQLILFLWLREAFSSASSRFSTRPFFLFLTLFLLWLCDKIKRVRMIKRTRRENSILCFSQMSNCKKVNWEPMTSQVFCLNIL